MELGAVMVLNGLFDCNLDTELCEMKAKGAQGAGPRRILG